MPRQLTPVAAKKTQSVASVACIVASAITSTSADYAETPDVTTSDVAADAGDRLFDEEADDLLLGDDGEPLEDFDFQIPPAEEVKYLETQLQEMESEYQQLRTQVVVDKVESELLQDTYDAFADYSVTATEYIQKMQEQATSVVNLIKEGADPSAAISAFSGAVKELLDTANQELLVESVDDQQAILNKVNAVAGVVVKSHKAQRDQMRTAIAEQMSQMENEMKSIKSKIDELQAKIAAEAEGNSEGAADAKPEESA